MIENLEGEIWKTVECFGNGAFQISNKGRLKKLAYEYKDCKGRKFNRPETLVKCHYREVKGRGYGYCTLCYMGQTKSITIHSLVAKAFIPNPENKPEVNHKDGNKHNNCVENLEWVTRAENMYHALHNDLLKPPIGENHFRAQKVVCYDYKTGAKLATFESANIASKFCGAKRCAHILEVCRGRRLYAYGYKWKFYEETVTTNENCNDNE